MQEPRNAGRKVLPSFLVSLFPAFMRGSLRRGAPHGPTPKGLSSPTLDAVIGDLRTCPAGASASEVAERLGMARVSARRYLEFLVTKGQVRIVPRYGTAGRPEKFYLWTGR